MPSKFQFITHLSYLLYIIFLGEKLVVNSGSPIVCFHLFYKKKKDELK